MHMSQNQTAAITLFQRNDQVPEDLGDALVMSGQQTDGSFNFAFSYLGFIFAVKAQASKKKAAPPSKEDQAHSSIHIHGHLGHLPYSGQNFIARINAMAILHEAREIPNNDISLTHDQQIVFKTNLDLDLPLTPTLLVTEASKLLLRIGPYLELLSMFLMAPKNQ